MTTVALTPTPRQLFLNPSNGAPAAGFKVFQYSAGTTTKQATYTDSTGLVANTNPIILDTLGEADIWLDVTKSYKLVFAPPTDTDPPTNPIWTRDNITVPGGGGTFSGGSQGSIGGLTLSVAGGTGTFGIAAGSATDSTGVYLMKLPSAYTKTTGAWSVGSGNGALDTGTIAISTWYSVFEIARLDTGVVDILFSLSATNPTLPAGYTIFRRIGSMLTDTSSHWVKFTQTGNQFVWAVPVVEYSATPGTLSSVVYTLGGVPAGISVFAELRGRVSGGSGTNGIVIQSFGETAAAFSSTTGQITALNQTAIAIGFDVVKLTNTSAQVNAAVSDTASVLNLATAGWNDPRGSQ